MTLNPPPPTREVKVVPSQAETGRPVRVDADIIAMMKSSGLDLSHAKLMGLRLATPDELAAMNRKVAKVAAIPYYDLDGNQIEFTRYRYLEDPRSAWDKWVLQRKALRYFQPAGTTVHAYFPPLINWREVAQNPKTLTLITEGEKKAAAVTALGVPCVGLGGVDCYAQRGDDAPLLPELMDFAWEGRRTVIVYDSDASTNPNVLAASVKLARRLMALGAEVSIAELPAAKDGSKQGIDDLLVATRDSGGSPREALTAIIEASSTELLERELALYSFNEKFVYVRDLDRVMDRNTFAMLAPDGFMRRAYASAKHREWKVVEAKDGSISRVPMVVSTAQAWMEWDQRLTVEQLDFDPNKPPFFDNKLNLWKGWNIEPREGNPGLWHEMLQHLFGHMPVDEVKWFEQWCAYPIQNPGAKLKTAVLVWSRAEGTGKSTILETLRRIYGDLYVALNDSAIDTQYTDWMVNRLFAGVDDISSRNRDDHAAKWKNFVTSPRMTVQKKYVPAFEIDCRVNFMMTSNEPNALRLSPHDRRYCILEAGAWGNREERAAFFNRYYNWLDNEDGARQLLGYFLTVDMTGFSPDAAAPVTEAKREMTELSGGTLERWLQDLLDAPDTMLSSGQMAVQGDLFTAEQLLDMFNARHPSSQINSVNVMVTALSNKGVPRAYKGAQIRLPDGRRVRLYILRNQARWINEHHGICGDHYAEVNKLGPFNGRGKGVGKGTKTREEKL